MSVTGIIADTHFPWVHPMYLRFCRDTFCRFNVKQVVHIGDVADNHAVAPNYVADPDGRSTGDEAKETLQFTKLWHKAFPKALVCIGNHDKRHILAAQKQGLSDMFLRSYAEIWETPTWKWAFSHEIDGVRYEHGSGSSGKNAALNRAIEHRQSTVIGHTHTFGGVAYHCNYTSRIFGMNVACGIDVQAYAFEYGADFVVRPVLGCGVVIDGDVGLFIPMPCGPREKYHRSRA